jgi:hypothetical protein
MTGTLQMLVEYIRSSAMDEMAELVATNPDKAIKKFVELADKFGPLMGMGPDLLSKIMGGNAPGAWGPFDDSPDTPVRYAGSTTGAKGEQLIDTVDGMIRMDQIPGYVDDPKWAPSPDWVDANCNCPEHRARREQNGPDDDPLTGMYL